MAVLITITNGIKVAHVVAVNAVPQEKVEPRTLEELHEAQGIQQTKMSGERRREVLFQQLDLSDLDGNQVAISALLAEYHDIFSLEPGELGYTNLAKHIIWVVDDEPFKSSSKGFPPYDGWGQGTHEGDVGRAPYTPQSKPMV